MAATFTSRATGTNFTGTGDTVTTSTAVTISASDILLVKFGWRLNAGQTLTAVHFNGSTTGLAPVSGASLLTADSSANGGVYIGTGLNGTANVDVQLSANSPAMMVMAEVIAGADLGTPLGTVVPSTGTDNPSDTTPSAIGGLCTDVYLLRNDNTMSPDSGQVNSSILGVGQGTQLGSSYEDGAASVSMGWSGNTGADNYAYLVIPINAAAGGGGPTLPWLPRQTNLSGPSGANMLAGGMTPPNRP